MINTITERNSQELLQAITQQTRAAVTELLDTAKLSAGQVLVVGCSSSEVIGQCIGTESSEQVAAAIVNGLLPVLEQRGVYLAAQCCEHLNRALIVERQAAVQYGLEPVNVMPQPKAGGSFATEAYRQLHDPVAVEHIRAHAGMDIGNTLIGMHLREVAVPVRLSVCRIGEAPLVCARTRPKFIGGSRAMYDEQLL